MSRHFANPSHARLVFERVHLSWLTELPTGMPGGKQCHAPRNPRAGRGLPAAPPHPGAASWGTPWSTRASGGGRGGWRQPSLGNEPPAGIPHWDPHLHVHYPGSQNPFPAQKRAILIVSTTPRGRTWAHREKGRRGRGGAPPSKRQHSDRRPHQGRAWKGRTAPRRPGAWRRAVMPPTPAAWT